MTSGHNVNRRAFLGTAGAGLAGAQTGPAGGRRTDSVWQSVDVLVMGGGPAGFGAALGATRAGARTLLLEKHAFCGGVGAWGMGMVINQMRPGEKPRGAVHELLIRRLQEYGDEAMYFADHALVSNVEYLKVAILDVLDAAGCPYFLHSKGADAIVEGDRVAGAVVATKEGLLKVRAKVVVDCTGDADIAFFSGAETMKGREGDGFLAPMTLTLIVTTVDVDAARAFAKGGGVKRVIAQGREKYPLLPDSFSLDRFPVTNCLTINHAGTKARGPLDASKVADFTEAERYSRRQAIQIVRALREFGGPAFAKVQLVASGPQVGVRETRRVKGLYMLTEEDAKTGRRFDDAIAWRSGFLDIGFVRYETMKVHDVPYRALVPEKMDGLLTAGRSISASHVAAAAGKSMGNCMATGHAAGRAAAMAVATSRQPRELKVADLQAALRKDGVDLERKGQA